MNKELIAKLANQCHSENGLHFDHEKFAELIIKECVSAIPLDMDHSEYLKAMRAVKNTFGVEE